MTKFSTAIILAVALATTFTSGVSASDVDTVIQSQNCYSTNDLPPIENGWNLDLPNIESEPINYVVYLNGVEVGSRVVLPGANFGFHIPFDPELIGTTVTIEKYDRNGRLTGSRKFRLPTP